MGTKMTNGAITIEVFSDIDRDFYKRAGYAVVKDAAPVAEESPKTSEDANAEAIAAVNKPAKAKK
jgi:hypothetical protein